MSNLYYISDCHAILRKKIINLFLFDEKGGMGI